MSSPHQDDISKENKNKKNFACGYRLLTKHSLQIKSMFYKINIITKIQLQIKPGCNLRKFFAVR